MKNKKIKEDLYKCGRCKITSETKDRMCPCPRGGCEAIIVGTITTTITKTLDKKLNKAQEKWNKNR